MSLSIDDLKDIIEGYKKLNTKDTTILWLSQRRLRHCHTCTLFTEGQTCNHKASGPHIITGQITSGCGCFMPAKTKMVKKTCPLGKW